MGVILVAAARPNVLTGLDEDRELCEAKQLHVCPLAQGESLTISALASDTRVAKVTCPTWS